MADEEFCYDECDTWCQPLGGHFEETEWGYEECVFDNCADTVPVWCYYHWETKELTCGEEEESCDTWCVPQGGKWVEYEKTDDFTNYTCD